MPEKPTTTDIKVPRQRRTDGDLMANYVMGKVQPQALPLEEAVLGALMLDRDAVAVVMDILRPDSFYAQAHQAIYKAILRLFERMQPIDLLTVTEELKKEGDLDKIGGPYYLVTLTNRVASAANIEYHARLIAQKHIQRELIRVSTKIIKDAYEDTTDVFNLLDDAEKGLFAIAQQSLGRSIESMGTLASRVLRQVEELSQKADGLTGVPTGFTDLDRLTAGWQPSDLIIMAARPGMGKTSMVLAIAQNAAMDFKKPVALFSLEMSNVQLVTRLLAMEAEISASKLRNGKLEPYEWQQLQSAIEKMRDVPIFIDDTPAINIFELRAKCRRLKMQHDIQLVVIDYLQLMSGGGESHKSGNREQEISSISRALKGLAKELNVPVIALSQLSRAVETRGGSKRPQLSDLRECVTGDTRIALADGSWRAIADCVGEQLEVMSIDTNTQKLVTQTTDLIWEVGTKPVYEITLTSGRKLKATSEHRLLTLEGWQLIGTLQEGGRVAIPRKLPEPITCMDISDDELLLLGHLVGDGSYLSGKPLRYTTASVVNSEVVTQAAIRAFGVSVNRHDAPNNGKWHQLVFSGNGNRWQPAGMNKWLRDIGIFNQRSHEKHLPIFVFRLANSKIAWLLQHLWATDGTIFTPKTQKTSSRIAFSTNSRQLADDVAYLLLRFAIIARIRLTPQSEHYKPMYSVEISGAEQQLHFLDKIGAFGDKIEKAELLKKYLLKKTANTNIDTIPTEIFHYVKHKMRERGISQRQMTALRGTAYGGSSHFNFAPSRQTVAHYAEVLSDEQLKYVANSDILWDKVKSIEFIGEEPVYDLTVPGYAAWIANGIFSHNSGAIEQDADIVSFIYRPDYYGITEDENGNSTKDMAELIIAKHRNGALDTVKLKFASEFAKFMNMDEINMEAFLSNVDFPSNNIITRPSKLNDDDDIPF